MKKINLKNLRKKSKLLLAVVLLIALFAGSLMAGFFLSPRQTMGVEAQGNSVQTSFTHPFSGSFETVFDGDDGIVTIYNNIAFNRIPNIMDMAFHLYHGNLSSHMHGYTNWYPFHNYYMTGYGLGPHADTWPFPPNTIIWREIIGAFLWNIQGPSVNSHFTVVLSYWTCCCDGFENIVLGYHVISTEEGISPPPDPPAPNGFEFSGWYRDAAFTQPFTGGVVTGDITLHARFVPIVYIIGFNLNGGTMGVTFMEFTIECETFMLPVPISRGRTFEGWYNNSDFTGTPIAEITQGTFSNFQLFARWSINTYTITYNLNGGSFVSTAPDTFTMSSANITLPIPHRDGFLFGGWFDNSALTGAAVTHIPHGSVDDREFFARWEVIIYNITYTLNGGNLTGHPTTFTIESDAITLVEPTRQGHYFRGWYSNAEFTGNPVAEIEQGTFGNIRLYARWEIMRFTVTFIVQGEVWQEIVVDYGTVLGQASLLDIESGELVEVFLDYFLSTAFHLDNAIVGDIELFATSGFSIMNSITFNVRGQRTTHWLPHNERLNVLFAPQHFGYVFVAWYHDEALEQRVALTDRLTSNIELFARFEPIIAIDYEPMPWFELWWVWVLAGLAIFAGGTIAILVVKLKRG
ncbi:MAG: InlB B-repeat-containing protein [Firmicutes bacterium]|nr:InlB B-repeat-containing protein [Bacillota bacterium]